MQHNDGAYQYKFVSEEKKDNLSIKTYYLSSQIWPIEPNQEIASSTWQHKLNLYIPSQIEHSQALLYIAGGYSYDKEGSQVFGASKELLDFSGIANTNKAVVAVIEDIPNQFLFINDEPKKEDQILAFTYKKVMEDPMQNAYLAGHLPMAKAAVKAMDAVQEILGDQIDEFVLVGASKRGWSAWLTALEDKRVSALIPVVVDILNVQKNIQHICNSYKECPPALRDYAAEGITSNIESKAFADLMQIEDPFSYINLTKYQQQASIPKYIINTSGDDFYAPDSSKFYFKALPGENYIRYLPDAMHYLAGNHISDYLGNLNKVNQAIDSYFYFHINSMELPKISWNRSDNHLIIDSSLKPSKVKLWVANNEDTRDFRFINSYSKVHLMRKTALTYLGKYSPFELCDTCYHPKEVIYQCNEEESCHIDIEIPPVNTGWQASFAEVFYNIAGRDFIVTTEITILPELYP